MIRSQTAWRARHYVLACVFLCAIVADARQVQVYTALELFDALNSTDVHHIILGHVEDGFELTEEALPHLGVTIDNRYVLLEGEYPGTPYIDANQLMDRVSVINGGELIQKNLWVDNCFTTVTPFTCFARPHHDGSVSMVDLEMSDSTCLELRQSKGILTIVESIHYLGLMDMQAVGIVQEEFSAAHGSGTRNITIKDSGWINFPPGSRWRMINTTMSCTGNVTHMLEGPPPQVVSMTIWTFIVVAPFTLAIGALLLFLAHVMRPRAASTSDAGSAGLPEHVLALQHGYDLQNQVGAGHYGRVFLAQPMLRGVPGTESRAPRAVWARLEAQGLWGMLDEAGQWHTADEEGLRAKPGALVLDGGEGGKPGSLGALG
ncbi:hypothetical protein H632_c6p7, partial [Helicosporidium sp. ATCC 50920]